MTAIGSTTTALAALPPGGLLTGLLRGAGADDGPGTTVPDTVNGFPGHPLFVHFAIGLVLLTAIGGILSAVWVRNRMTLVAWTAAIGVLASASTLIATDTGESLEQRVRPNPLIEKHAELGEQTRNLTIALTVAALVWLGVQLAMRRHRTRLVAEKRIPVAAGTGARTGESGAVSDPWGEEGAERRPAEDRTTEPRAKVGGRGLRTASHVLAVVVLALAVLSGVWVYRAGEEGARAVWQHTPTTPASSTTGG